MIVWHKKTPISCIKTFYDIMTILDSKGRLFGKVSIIDVGAALVILLVVVSIFFFPGTGGSVAQVGVASKPIEVDLVVRGVNVRDPQTLFSKGLKQGGKTSVIIRNQPHGEIEIKSLKTLPRTVLVNQPDGSVRELRDPRANQFSTDMLLTLRGIAQITDTGPVLGNSKIKIGTTLELEGFNYDFNASVIDVRINDAA